MVRAPVRSPQGVRGQVASRRLRRAWRSHGVRMAHHLLLTMAHYLLLTTYYLLLTTYYCAPLALRALAQPVAAALARVQTLLVVRLVRPPVIVEELLVAG